MATLFGWYRSHGNNTKAQQVSVEAVFVTGDGRFATYGVLQVTRADGAQLAIRMPPAEFARLAAQMASVQLAAEAGEA